MMQSGIYQWRNLINSKIYIGSAIILFNRKSTHLQALRLDKHANSKLQRAFNKYEESNFIFEILELVEDKTKLIEREQYYIDTLNPQYNICRIAGSSLGTKRTENSKKKMKLAAKDRPPVSEETRKKQSESRRGRKVLYSEKTLKEIRERLGVKIHRYDFEGKYIDSFISIQEAVEICKYEWGMIKKAIKGYKITTMNCYFSKDRAECIDTNNFIHLKKGGYKEKNKERSKCNHCDMITNIGNLTRHHNENCKFNPIRVSVRGKEYLV